MIRDIHTSLVNLCRLIFFNLVKSTEYILVSFSAPKFEFYYCPSLNKFNIDYTIVCQNKKINELG